VHDVLFVQHVRRRRGDVSISACFPSNLRLRPRFRTTMQWEYVILPALVAAGGIWRGLARRQRGGKPGAPVWEQPSVLATAPRTGAAGTDADGVVSEAAAQHLLERMAFGLERLFAAPAPLPPECAGMFGASRPSPAAVAAAAKRLGGQAAGSGLLARLGDPATPLGTAAALVSADPILAGHVLTIANSPLFGLRGQLADVEKAIAVIGLANLRALVFSELLEQGGHQAGLPRAARQTLVGHMARTAVLARRIAPALPGLDPAMAYTAGLLHDVGKLALPAAAAEGRSRPPQEEVARWGDHHGAAGWAVCRRFELPADVGQAVRLHHGPLWVELEDLEVELAQARLAVAVALADGLAQALDGGEAAAIVPLRHSYRFLLRETVLADALADPGLAGEMGRAMALVRLACGEAA
jgi:putative nucleotidyltransferase with HDIG domain